MKSRAEKHMIGLSDGYKELFVHGKVFGNIGGEDI